MGLFRHFAGVFIAFAFALTATDAPRALAQSPPPAATDAEIARLISQLSDPAFERRVGASRRLCAIGAPAIEALKGAAAGEDTEAALRAKKILNALDRVLFSGIEVQLEADRTAVSWDQPVELRLVLENRSRHPARIPFASGSDQSETTSADAGQVATMIDASDWLVVRNDRGREVLLHVDEISDDKAVWQVIQDRIRSGPLSDVSPGERRIIVLSDFNRGWARYPLLQAGLYSVQFRYVPEWLDSVLAKDQVGQVQSAVLNLEVIESAPAGVSAHGAHAEVFVRREGAQLVASLTNRHDHTIQINTNFGVSAPFAEIKWVYERDGRRTAVSAIQQPGRSWTDFDAARFIKLKPGESMDLVQWSVPDVMEAFRQAGENLTSSEGSISFSYFNLCDRQWQFREQANLARDIDVPEFLRGPLPREILSARLGSASIRWTPP